MSILTWLISMLSSGTSKPLQFTLWGFFFQVLKNVVSSIFNLLFLFPDFLSLLFFYRQEDLKEATEAAEAAKVADIERQKQEEQRRQIQDALNRQSYNEFRSYAEQQVLLIFLQ